MSPLGLMPPFVFHLVLLVGCAPYIALFTARRAWLAGWRDNIILASRLAASALGLAGAVRSRWPGVGMQRMYGRPAGVLAWIFLVLPLLQRLTLRVQLATVLPTLALSFVTLYFALQQAPHPAVLLAG